MTRMRTLTVQRQEERVVFTDTPESTARELSRLGYRAVDLDDEFIYCQCENCGKLVFDIADYSYDIDDGVDLCVRCADEIARCNEEFGAPCKQVRRKVIKPITDNPMLRAYLAGEIVEQIENSSMFNEKRKVADCGNDKLSCGV